LPVVANQLSLCSFGIKTQYFATENESSLPRK